MRSDEIFNIVYALGKRIVADKFHVTGGENIIEDDNPRWRIIAGQTAIVLAKNMGFLGQYFRDKSADPDAGGGESW